MNTPNKASAIPAPLPRRLAAIVYDGFLIAALLMVTSLPAVLLNDGPIRDGSTFGDIKNALFLVYLSGWVLLFYGWFWTHGGQTLGMTAWKIRITGENGGAVTWRQTFIRLTCACLGFANLGSLFNHQRRGWHEKLSKTKTVLMIPAESKSPPLSSR